MKDRTNQRGQALVYTGVISLVLFSVAALAVDVGRHVFVRREAQAVADATATPTPSSGAAPDILCFLSR